MPRALPLYPNPHPRRLRRRTATPLQLGIRAVTSRLNRTTVSPGASPKPHPLMLRARLAAVHSLTHPRSPPPQVAAARIRSPGQLRSLQDCIHPCQQLHPPLLLSPTPGRAVPPRPPAPHRIHRIHRLAADAAGEVTGRGTGEAVLLGAGTDGREVVGCDLWRCSHGFIVRTCSARVTHSEVPIGSVLASDVCRS